MATTTANTKHTTTNTTHMYTPTPTTQSTSSNSNITKPCHICHQPTDVDAEPLVEYRDHVCRACTQKLTIHLACYTRKGSALPVCPCRQTVRYPINHGDSWNVPPVVTTVKPQAQ